MGVGTHRSCWRGKGISVLPCHCGRSRSFIETDSGRLSLLSQQHHTKGHGPRDRDSDSVKMDEGTFWRQGETDSAVLQVALLSLAAACGVLHGSGPRHPVSC